jgi:hypothetical protein
LQDSKSHHERELKAAEAQVAKARKEADQITKEAGSQQQAMQTLRLEVEEMEKSLSTQQQQVGWGGGGVSATDWLVGMGVVLATGLAGREGSQQPVG